VDPVRENYEILAERIEHVKELGDLRDKLQQKALEVAAAQSNNRITTVIAILSVLVAAWALKR
jgi:hypothetical protein